MTNESTGDRAHRPMGYLKVIDEHGRRHLIRHGAIQMLYDSDVCQDSTVIVVSGRAIMVPRPLTEMLRMLEEGMRR